MDIFPISNFQTLSDTEDELNNNNNKRRDNMMDSSSELSDAEIKKNLQKLRNSVNKKTTLDCIVQQLQIKLSNGKDDYLNKAPNMKNKKSDDNIEQEYLLRQLLKCNYKGFTDTSDPSDVQNECNSKRIKLESKIYSLEHLLQNEQRTVQRLQLKLEEQEKLHKKTKNEDLQCSNIEVLKILQRENERNYSVIKEKDEQILSMKKDIEEIQEENNKLKELNYNLQRQVIDFFNEFKESSSAKGPVEKKFDIGYINENEQIHIGQGIWLPLTAYSVAISDLNSDKVGAFVNNIANLIIPKEVMLKSTITGSKCHRNKPTESADKLPPHYILAIKGIVKYWLESLNADEVTISNCMDNVKKYLRSKLAEAKRSAKRPTSQSDAERTKSGT